ncbi:hypothetical protein C8J57DRAFT_1563201 [Mycena rebaudengoi]|nr:hypothetical protein C8J57DRAFT_1563201 [Mycena rebaudengoi]
MFLVTTLQDGSTITVLSGPEIVGYLLNWGLFGSLTVQLYLYYRAFPHDRLVNKWLVYTVYTIEFVQTMLITYAAFSTFGYGFGDPAALRDLRLEWLTVPVMSGCVSFIGQSFYAYRLYVLSKSPWLPVFCVVIALLSAIASFVTGSFAFKAGSNLSVLATPRKIASGVWLGTSALNDIIITICLAYYLWKHDSRFRHTHALIVKLIRLTIETGSVTALVAIIDFVLLLGFPGKHYFIAAGIILPKLYANSMFAVLNSRFQIVGGRGYSSSGNIMSGSSFIRNAGNGGPDTHPGPAPVVSIRKEVFEDRELDDLVSKTNTIGFRSGTTV